MHDGVCRCTRSPALADRAALLSADDVTIHEVDLTEHERLSGLILDLRLTGSYNLGGLGSVAHSARTDPPAGSAGRSRSTPRPCAFRHQSGRPVRVLGRQALDLQRALWGPANQLTPIRPGSVPMLGSPSLGASWRPCLPRSRPALLRDLLYNHEVTATHHLCDSQDHGRGGIATTPGRAPPLRQPGRCPRLGLGTGLRHDAMVRAVRHRNRGRLRHRDQDSTHTVRGSSLRRSDASGS